MPRLAALAAATLFSTGGAAIKACHLTGWQVACFRSGVAAVALLLFLPVSRRMNGRSFAFGTAYAATLIMFVCANKLTTAAHTIFLQSTAPLYLLILGPWLLRERIKRGDLLFVFVMLAGIALLLWESPSFVTAPRPLLGNVLALASGLAWAITLAGLRWSENSGGGAVVISGNLIAFSCSFAPALPVIASEPSDWLIIGYLGIVQIGLAYALLTYALRHLAAFEVSLLVLLEPALNPFWVWLVQGERIGPWSISGCALVLIATAGKALFEARAHKGSPSTHDED